MCGTDDNDCTPCPAGESCTASGNCQTTSCPAPNQHICGNACVDQSATQGGAGCTTCPPPAADKNSTATCTTTGMCRNVCKSASFHRCAGTDVDPSCKSNNSVESCGSNCTPCSPATLANGVVGGSGTDCTFTCNDDFHKCTQDTTPICLASNSVESCGTRCGRCADSTQIGANPTPICEMVAANRFECGLTCVDSTKKCGVGAAAVCCSASQTCTNGACVAHGAGGAGN